jgi:pyrroloquinoline quinone biosynthesis protein B
MGRLTAIVLGAAAGGGFPQWNCCCAVCRLAWAGDSRVVARTQASLAVTGDGRHWVLLNASPDLRQQIAATKELHPQPLDPRPPDPRPSDLQPLDLQPLDPKNGVRGSPIAAVVLTGAEIDQTAGLLNLRERQMFDLYATAQTVQVIADNPMFDVLAPDMVARHAIKPGEPFELPGNLRAELFLVPGKVPLYLEGDNPDTDAETEANVGIEVSAGGSRLAFVPGCGAVTPPLLERLSRADIIFFDATLFTDDEMVAAGIGSKTGRRMGHMPVSGAGGSLAALAHLPARRIHIHINNSNPILVTGSPQRRAVEEAGWDVAFDGMRIET